jgi:hypothetical protein
MGYRSEDFQMARQVGKVPRPVSTLAKPEFALAEDNSAIAVPQYSFGP